MFFASYKNIDDLKESIRHEIEAIYPEMLRKVRSSFRNRIQACMDNNGAHIPDIVFKTQESKNFALNCNSVENQDSNSIYVIFINFYNPGICAQYI